MIRERQVGPSALWFGLAHQAHPFLPPSLPSSLPPFLPPSLPPSLPHTEILIGEDKLIRFSGCKSGAACSVVLRGASAHLLEEAERSLHDALCVLSQTVRETRTIPGGGCAEVAMAQVGREGGKEGGREGGRKYKCAWRGRTCVGDSLYPSSLPPSLLPFHPPPPRRLSRPRWRPRRGRKRLPWSPSQGLCVRYSPPSLPPFLSPSLLSLLHSFIHSCIRNH